MSPNLSAWVVACALCVISCAGPLDSAKSTFDSGRYPEALEELRRAEPLASHAPPDVRRRYALYRGLAHLALGDARAAQHWLGRVKREWDLDPSILDPHAQGQLLTAWQSMGHLPGDGPP